MTYLRSCTEWEMRLFRSCRISGAFLYGEIGMDLNRNALHIGSNVLFGLSESDTDYLPIDRSILGELQSLDEDWEDIYPYIIKIKNEQLSQQHLDFSSQIFQREENLRSDVFVDKETRLGNLVKYKYDNTKAQYDKICMISIEQGVLISGRRGTKVWNRVMQKNIQQIRTTLNDDRLSFYCNDKWSFFFTAEKSYPDDLFLQKSEQAFRDCGYCFCKEHSITAVNNFHVVIGETDLLEKVQLCMSSNADHNARFFVYNKENQEIIRQMDEKLFMTNVISDAILYDRIVPYFQPIRDNRTKKITKYEALMRLSDKDKNIYAPGQFLEIAKDYHLYLQLSQLMIRKVLHLFKNRTESIFINLSAYDIGSKSNRTFLYELLSSLSPDACQRITFEILESEKIRDFQEMVAFLNDIRRFGVKIAIDDFGAGFSNFTAIIRVNPDFIKIDGDLIINCDKDPVKQVCLQAITDIAKGIDAELIAEHVENSDEQKTVESVNIEYTQGYYFSKPVPYDRLDAAIS
jgi:EAL domain-containing protein (putative c-di-GMP-specific phosphodiesterase class I)